MASGGFNWFQVFPRFSKYELWDSLKIWWKQKLNSLLFQVEVRTQEHKKNNIGRKVNQKNRSSCSQLFSKIYFPNFTGKHLCWSCFLVKLQPWSVPPGAASERGNKWTFLSNISFNADPIKQTVKVIVSKKIREIIHRKKF